MLSATHGDHVTVRDVTCKASIGLLSSVFATGLLKIHFLNLLKSVENGQVSVVTPSHTAKTVAETPVARLEFPRCTVGINLAPEIAAWVVYSPGCRVEMSMH